MRHRSRTNSKPGENIELRNQYRNDNPFCELAKAFPSLFYEKNASAVHHIWQSGTRWDIVTNLISVSPVAHDWCHQNPVDGKIVCIWVKHDKGEFDCELYREKIGRCPIGYIECCLDNGSILTDEAYEAASDILERY